MKVAKTHEAAWVDAEEASRPIDGQVITDRYWVTRWNEDKLEILFVLLPGRPKYASPQCNRQKYVAEHIRDSMYPECQVNFVKTVYMGHYRQWAYGDG